MTLNASFPIVDEEGKMVQAFRDEMDRLSRAIPLRGTGSPETVVPGFQFQSYVDETGALGSVFYIKQLADIGGDTKQGWILIG